MKKIFLISIIISSVLSCGNNQKEEGVEEVRIVRSKTLVMTMFSVKSNVLIQGYDNEVLVSVSTIDSENLKIIADGKSISVDKYGLCVYSPTYVGEVWFEVYANIDGKDEFYGKVKFHIVSPETTIGDIFKLN